MNKTEIAVIERCDNIDLTRDVNDAIEIYQEKGYVVKDIKYQTCLDDVVPYVIHNALIIFEKHDTEMINML